ncbi:ROK family transcriptional regulator [Devosia sp. Leaf64]|uniref:ROK family protein n=1 Tax=Devosia sp. Leaf64 TaxID=1736229 RepID=UPI000714F83B|nr:ROK family transcriptional regulator [Devosia sp. Leaf64]KQN75231.1 hypothetical protein ASE94_02655 [Devosia sp. Leaf64]
MEEATQNQRLNDDAMTPRRVPLSARKNSQAGYLRLLVEAMMLGEPLQRPALAQRVGLSRLAVSELLATLETRGLVEVKGALGGTPGRSQLFYALRTDAALNVGFDVGGTKVAGAIADLRGVILAELTEPTVRTGLAGLVGQLSSMVDALCEKAQVPRYRLRAAGIGVPAAVQPDTNVLSLADNLPGLEDGDFPAALREALGVDVLIDNDVNLALLAEVGHGSARDRGNVAFIALGTGIGGALVINGKLLRGAHGGAGEMGYMPLWTIENRGVPGLEERVGEAGIRRFYTAAGGDASHVVRDIFEMAAAGNGPALSTLDTTAEHVARAALTVLALIDPDVIVLGGSIGSRPELIERVRTRVEEAWMRPIEIVRSQSGGRAGLLGAVEFSNQHMLEQMFGSHPRA